MPEPIGRDISKFVDAVLFKQPSEQEDHLATGIRDLDQRVQLFAGELSVVAGPPSIGKTSFAVGLLIDNLSDEAITGSIINRENYVRLKADACKRELQYIVVDDLSRLGRDTAESIAVFRELAAIGVNIVGVADGIDTSANASKLPYYLKSMMNEVFLDDLREKVRRGLRGQVARGYPAGGKGEGIRGHRV